MLPIVLKSVPSLKLEWYAYRSESRNMTSTI